MPSSRTSIKSERAARRCICSRGFPVIRVRGKRPTSSSSRIATGRTSISAASSNFDVQIYDIRNTSAPKKDLRVDDRESRAAPRHRRDGREVLQDRQQVLLRAVVPVHAGQPGHRPRRGDLRRHRAARREQGEGRRAHSVSGSRRADSTTPSPTSTPTDARCTSRRSVSRRRSSTISRRS